MNPVDVQDLIDSKLQSSFKSLAEDDAKKIFKLFHIPVVHEQQTDMDVGNILGCGHRDIDPETPIFELGNHFQDLYRNSCGGSPGLCHLGGYQSESDTKWGIRL